MEGALRRDPGPPLLLSACRRSRSPGRVRSCRDSRRWFATSRSSRVRQAGALRPTKRSRPGSRRPRSRTATSTPSSLTRRIEVDLEAYTARVDVHFETGQRYFFGPVRFHQDLLDSAYVHSFVTFKTGEPYNVDSLTAMQRALGASPYFSRVEVEPRRDEATDLVVPIDVRAGARETAALRAGRRLRNRHRISGGGHAGIPPAQQEGPSRHASARWSPSCATRRARSTRCRGRSGASSC